MGLRAEINIETDELIISEMDFYIEKKSYAVISLAKNEIVDSLWDFEAKWVINKKDFKCLITSHVNELEITGCELLKIFFHGEERNDLKQNVTVIERENEIMINYKNCGSGADLCQLNNTLMILLDVSYEDLAYRTHRYFNLNLDF